PPALYHGALDQHVEAAGGLALGEDRAGRDDLDAPLLAQPGDLLVGELLEQEERAQLFRVARGYRCHDKVSRYRCTNITAIAPSPTAEATRLADSARTSPATNTPGALVSRWYGGLSSCQPYSSCCSRSGPASTKPRGSRATTPSSHPVPG